MENGSGGTMSDLTFTGGRFGCWLGNQQFTVQRLHFFRVQTAIFQAWNWCFLYQDVKIEKCGIGLEIKTGTTETAQAVATEILCDWIIEDTTVGVKMSAESSGTLIL